VWCEYVCVHTSDAFAKDECVSVCLFFCVCVSVRTCVGVWVFISLSVCVGVYVCVCTYERRLRKR